MRRHRKRQISTAVMLGGLVLGATACYLPLAPAPLVPIYCSPPYRIDWPEANPVWSLCWTPPNASSGISGSGLELRHVFYRGRQVFWQAHVPVLNVKYDPGGCGGSDLSYRDWQNSLAPFEADNQVQPGYAEPTTPPKTVCDHPGTDAGTFAGVAVEKKPDELTLTTQMEAGWYRYIQTWTFRLDGTIEPRFGFTAITNPCTSKPHTHHVYWRFDFDVDDASNDAIDEGTTCSFLGLLCWSSWQHTQLEAINLRDPAQHRKWRVRDKASGRGYEIIPNDVDGVADSWAVADVWALHYHPNETDDGGATGGPNGDAAHMNNYLNSEGINGEDVVLWYRAGHRHDTGIGCKMVGPTLKPIGSW